ncbi:phosphodiesterase family protein [Peptostreptococcus anaerobius 653-L]|uniref:Phosphoesterase n=1 Tax=Peptostreptococcus anaerobius 653-L TaxID=596329 RepID=D3MQP5_9FIRM|nr:metallophosphoesterase [Peptostreptococcus anaerobius]EFD05551.1 phosphodiesterase family protein [Peptostreptococcus anaerobius 653-L]
MKLLILSDSHHSIDRLNKLLSIIEEEKIDIIIHAGDNFRDSVYLKEKSKKSVIGVIGNCDFENTDREIEFELEGLKFFLTHGHRYSVKYGPEILASKGQEIGANIVIYGHTHIKDDTYMGGLLILNPGSLSQPRDGSRGSYVVMDLDNGSYQYNYFYI